MSSPIQKLNQIAQAMGIHLSYRNNFGEEKFASPEVLKKVLGSMGIQLSDDLSNAQSVLEKIESDQALKLVEPCFVAWEGNLRGPVLKLKSGAKISNEIHFELSSQEFDMMDRWSLTFSELRWVHSKDGHDFFEWSMPRALAIGYYELKIKFGSENHQCVMMVAPKRVRRPKELDSKIWGIFSPIYSLRRENDMACGDYTALGELMDWSAKMGAKTLATLPLLASIIEDWKSDPSPYSPASRIFWNDFFVDPTLTEEFKNSEAAQKYWKSESVQQKLKALRAEELVDYDAIASIRRPLFETLAEAAFDANREARSEAFRIYLKNNRQVEEYARFRAFSFQQKASWWCWNDRAKAGDLSAEKIDSKLIRYYLYVQFLAEQQLSALSHRARQSNMAFYLDLPVGVHSDGYDVWKNRSNFLLGLAAGAPPDPFFTGGQNWGFPPFSPQGIRNDGYQHFRQIIRHHLSEAKILRMDHVMGFFRIYVVPNEVSATEGVYISFQLDEFVAVALIEAHRAGAAIVGEDLGTVPDEIKNAMENHGLDRLFVFEYEADASKNPVIRPIPENVVASLNTHDMPMFASYWRGHDIDERVAMGIMSADQIRDARAGRQELKKNWILDLKKSGQLSDKQSEQVNDESVVKATYRKFAQSPAWTLLVTIEDLWMEEKPQNVPGTYKELPNWRRKYSKNSPEIFTNIEYQKFFKEINLDRSKLNQRQEEFTGLLSSQDLHYFNEGTHTQLYKKMGAKLGHREGVAGCYFSVWAPNAEQVTVIGSFNEWNFESHPMQSRNSSGVWEVFIPNVKQGCIYKYAVRSKGSWKSLEKADPYASAAELPPRTGSVVYQSEFQWSDQEWMTKKRLEKNSLESPISIYEIHLSSWKRKVDEGNRWLTYREMAPEIASYMKELNFSHLEILPLMEFPFDGSWGYQSLGYFAPTSRFGSPDDFKYFVNYLHQQGIAVVLDWVPSHFPADAHGLAEFDGTSLYEHADPRKGFHPDWKSCIFNYSRNEVRSFLLSSAHIWLDEYHVDALRVDAVASMLYLDYSRKEGEWIPNVYGGRENLEAMSFLRVLNESVYSRFPGVQMIAEESTAWGGVSRPTYLGGLGFGMKWDMGWMHDTLKFFTKDSIHRKFHLGDLTFRGLYAFTENFVLGLSHDEVVHGKGSLINKMSGDDWQKFANLRLLYAYQWTLSGKKLVFMGCEFAQRDEWNHNQSLDWHLLQHQPHQGIKNLIRDLNGIYQTERGLHADDFSGAGFEWVETQDSANTVLAYARKNPGFDDDTVMVVLNLTPIPRENYRLGVSLPGIWEEILNSDAKIYGGTGLGNYGAVASERIQSHGRLDSIRLTLPPLGAIVLRKKS